MTTRKGWSIVATLVAASSAMAVAQEPVLKWAYRADSNLYAPPLVADLCSTPGLETVVSDSEVRRLVCVDAQGKRVWTYDGGWTKRLTTGAALSVTARPGAATLLIGGGDGKLTCLDGATGTVLWQKDAGNIEWGAALWADLDGDGQDEAVAATERQGVHVFEAGGTPCWDYARLPGDREPAIRCPAAAADIDGTGLVSLFGAGELGPFCLNGDGTLRWERLTGDEFVSAAVIADANGDGAPELYAASRNENALHCFDARTGEPLWKTATIGEADVYPSSCIAVGDVDQDGLDEIVAGDTLGYVYCLSCTGEVLWVFETGKRTHAAASLGDVDGDGQVEVLIASGDHDLYGVDNAGRLEWRYAADLRLIYAPTISDVDNDGKTDILCCGSDKTLRCLTLGGRYRPELVPWPSRRFDAAQSGACFGKRAAATTASGEEALLEYGGFEQARPVEHPEAFPADGGLLEAQRKAPRGWSVARAGAGTLALDATMCVEGAASLKTEAATEPLIFYSDPMTLDGAIRAVQASVETQGGTPSAALRWSGLAGILREDPLVQAGEAAGWTRWQADGARPPRGARWLRLVCTTAAGTTTWWDAASVAGRYERPRELRALVNQVGYDVGAPKRFTARSNFLAQQASFAVLDADGREVFSAALRPEGRIVGAFGHDWGYEHWRGDFSAFDVPGDYRIRVVLDDVTDVSWPFRIAQDLLWNATAVPAYHFFYYQRCGMAIPGFHGACHLDDAASPDGKTQYELWGGWHDAGDYNTYHNAPYVLGLARAYGLRDAAFARYDADGNGQADFLDEILWGGEHSRRMIAPDGSAYGAITSGYGFWGPPELETDNLPGTGDERRIQGQATGHDSAQHLGAMAKIARYVDDKGPWVAAADRALAWAVANGKRGPVQFAAVVDLYVATGDAKYAALAKEWFPGADPDFADAVREYDARFGEDHSDALREQFVARADALLTLAENPYGVYTHGPKERPNFFGTAQDQSGWHVGNNSFVLNAANLAVQAYRYAPDPRYLAFAYDQFNWILGNNPFDISLMEGAGSAFLPTYHHRYTFSGVPRGAVPGCVVNGVTWRGVGDDRPYVDLRGLDIAAFEPNEVWLPHNTAYLNALANLCVARD